MTLQLGPELDKAHTEFQKSSSGIKVEDPDLRRMDFALQLMRGRSALDVGIAWGLMTNALADMHKARKVTALDISWHSKLVRKKGVKYVQKSLLDKNFNLERHDTVYCMEVIEHLNVANNEDALANLRKSTRQRLVVTVPYLEPEPLWWHDKPGGHRQRFTLDKLSEMFPTGVATFIPRWGVDWVVVVEDKDIKSNAFVILSQNNLLDLVANANEKI